MNIEHRDEKYEIYRFTYSNGRMGLLLNSENKSTPIVNCTINFGHYNHNEVIIKNYNENNGIYQKLIELKLIRPYTRKTNVGYNQGLICRVNLTYYNKLQQWKI